jgi:hypothetical protein
MAYTDADIQARAEALLGGNADEERKTALGAVCAAARGEIEARLRDGASPESIGEAYVTACGMLAIAMCLEAQGASDVASFSAGSVSVTKSASRARYSAAGLRKQAESLLAAYLADGGFAFMGVKG